MRKLIVSMNVTLNGFMAGPFGELDWHLPYWDEEMARAAAQQLANADTLLLGRITYQAMAPYWSAQMLNARADADYAYMMNNYEKIIFSKTLSRVCGWRNTRLSEKSLSSQVKQLKHLPGKDILVYGSGKLVAALTKYNLVDEYRLWLHPVVLKKGRPLFNITGVLNLKPVMIKTFENGVVLMALQPI